MIKPLLPTAAVLALVSLAGCNSNNSGNAQVIDTVAPDPMASVVANAAPVTLPPAIESSVTFRCQPGNSLLYVDFYSGGKMAALKTTKDGTPTMLNAPNAGEPYVSGPYKIVGNAKSATITTPDGTKTCKA